MKRQDDIDTAPVIVKDDMRVTFESVELAPGDRAELVLAPERPLRCPMLFMSATHKNYSITIEQVVHGRVEIFSNEKLSIDHLRFGKATGLTITESEPIKIIIVNTGLFKTTVGASLVANDQSQDTTYHLSGDKLAKNKE